ncbi:hypothetical protein QIU18_07055 [Capnocytophaga canimorsus]|nr:hypothetical protein [Capnocytophaga canimorsus]WGU69376.1 hypothetical protein QIU19_06680 [Capnocytophaga canimorsus]WGU71505.1 hypothetical protein QIU18_07055 [Capnocytophaga canimorsus]
MRYQFYYLGFVLVALVEIFVVYFAVIFVQKKLSIYGIKNRNNNRKPNITNITTNNVFINPVNEASAIIISLSFFFKNTILIYSRGKNKKIIIPPNEIFQKICVIFAKGFLSEKNTENSIFYLF